MTVDSAPTAVVRLLKKGSSAYTGTTSTQSAQERSTAPQLATRRAAQLLNPHLLHALLTPHNQVGKVRHRPTARPHLDRFSSLDRLAKPLGVMTSVRTRDEDTKTSKALERRQSVHDGLALGLDVEHEIERLDVGPATEVEEERTADELRSIVELGRQTRLRFGAEVEIAQWTRCGQFLLEETDLCLE